MPAPQERIAIAELSDTAYVRRRAVALAAEAGASEAISGTIAIVATELATNILKHAGHGEILIRLTSESTSAEVELMALDKGPGMKDVECCFVDGYSTAGSPGTGLGAVRRVASVLDVYSDTGKGTVVMARVACERHSGSVPHPVEIGVACQPLLPLDDCGDAWQVIQQGGRIAILVADGLGHGSVASVASVEAVGALSDEPFEAPAEVLGRAHRRMSNTRGGAVAVAQADIASGDLHYAAVGNISAFLLHQGQSRGLITYDGIVGGQTRLIKQITYPRSAGSLLVMHSDGLQSRWRLADYPGLAQRHPAVIAGVLYRDYRRKSDDVTVLIVAFPS